ncbi:MAG: hypothetical protein EBU90_01480 [Proteobacteria bacterium]|nr:hypothetical protein [Pseudomonadota bacterium]
MNIKRELISTIGESLDLAGWTATKNFNVDVFGEIKLVFTKDNLDACVKNSPFQLDFQKFDSDGIKWNYRYILTCELNGMNIFIGQEVYIKWPPEDQILDSTQEEVYDVIIKFFDNKPDRQD